jgi:hypothetical protein
VVTRTQEVDELYARAIEHFNNSTIRVFAAQYYNIYRNNHRIEQMLLAEAEVRRSVRDSVARVLVLCSDGGLRGPILPA